MYSYTNDVFFSHICLVKIRFFKHKCLRFCFMGPLKNLEHLQNIIKKKVFHRFFFLNCFLGQSSVFVTVTFRIYENNFIISQKIINYNFKILFVNFIWWQMHKFP